MLTDIWSKKDKFVLNTLVILWLTALSMFFHWWIQYKHVGTSMGFFLTSLVLLWTYGLPAYCFVFILKMKTPDKGMEINQQYRIAMIVTKAPSEPLSILQKTLEGMLAQAYPHDTWVADENPTLEALDWYNKHGVFVSTRKDFIDYHNDTWPRRKKCKEGNLAFFYDHFGYKHYDIVVQMDADHVPYSGYLEHMIRPFTDPKVGYTAAPSICDTNYNTSWASRARGHAEAIFHGPIQCGTNSNWVPICIGSHYAVRTAALKEIGGIGPELAEDYSTTLLMNAHGWKGVWSFDAEAHGLGPNSFKDLIVQDFQWAKSLAILSCTFFPKYLKHLNFRQKVQFLFTQAWYPVSALMWLTSILLILGALITGQPQVIVSFDEFFKQAIRPLLIGYLIYLYVHRKKHLRPNTVPLISWESMFFELVRWPWVFIGCLSAVHNTFIQKKSFNIKVTPKTKPSTDIVSIGIILPYFFVIAVFLAAMNYAGYVDKTAGYYWFAATMAGLYTVLIVFVILLHIKESEKKLIKQTLRHIPHVTVASLFGLALFFTVKQDVGGMHTQMASTETKSITFSQKTNADSSRTEQHAANTDNAFMYTVVEGDSLWEIAERFYGDGIKWKDITTVSNSKNIRPGDRLTIHVKSN